MLGLGARAGWRGASTAGTTSTTRAAFSARTTPTGRWASAIDHLVKSRGLVGQHPGCLILRQLAIGDRLVKTGLRLRREEGLERITRLALLLSKLSQSLARRHRGLKIGCVNAEELR